MRVVFDGDVPDHKKEEVFDFISFFRNNRSLDSLLPCYLPCSFLLTHLPFDCAFCSKPMALGHCAASVSSFDSGGVLVSSWLVKGVCSHCRQISEVQFRFQGDGFYYAKVGVNPWCFGSIRRSPLLNGQSMKWHAFLSRILGYIKG